VLCRMETRNLKGFMSMLLEAVWPGISAPDLAFISTEHLMCLMFGQSLKFPRVFGLVLIANGAPLNRFRATHQHDHAIDVPDPSSRDESLEGILRLRAGTRS
jgi:hypothetical protein